MADSTVSQLARCACDLSRRRLIDGANMVRRQCPFDANPVLNSTRTIADGLDSDFLISA